MSLEFRVQHLEDLVVALRQEAAELKARLTPRSGASFDLVSSAEASSRVPAAANAVPASPPRVFRSNASSPAPTVGFRPTPRQESARASVTPVEHLAACREIGLVLRRAFEGAHRGPSGRDRIPLASRLWLVARDCQGEDLVPAVVCHKFSVRCLCKRGADCECFRWPSGPQ